MGKKKSFPCPMCNGKGELEFYGPYEGCDEYLDDGTVCSTYMDGCTLCQGSGLVNKKIYESFNDKNES